MPGFPLPFLQAAPHSRIAQLKFHLCGEVFPGCSVYTGALRSSRTLLSIYFLSNTYHHLKFYIYLSVSPARLYALEDRDDIYLFTAEFLF